MVPPRTAMQQQQLGTRSRPVQLAGGTAFAAMGATGTVVAGARHPYMHRTDTVDYAVVMQGSITMLLDDEDVELSAGDVVIRVRRTSGGCRVAACLQSGSGRPEAVLDGGSGAAWRRAVRPGGPCGRPGPLWPSSGAPFAAYPTPPCGPGCRGRRRGPSPARSRAWPRRTRSGGPAATGTTTPA